MFACLFVPYKNSHFWTNLNQILHTSLPWSGRDRRVCMVRKCLTFLPFLTFFVGSCQPIMGNQGQCGSMPNIAQTNMTVFMGPMGNNPTQCHSMPSPAQANARYLGPAMPTSPANCYGARGQTSQQLSQQHLTSPAAGAPAPQQASNCVVGGRVRHSVPDTSNNLPRMKHQRLPVQF